MRTITIDILDEKALKFLKNLEDLQLIKLRKNVDEQPNIASEKLAKYKGAMSKKKKSELDSQLDELRSGWE